ncbi:MAG: class I SAM-dependent methyltransferase [Candidatus Schekmanbacteria bacterium]|nr:class I SAM-dependent methyltransferase [Candidatus Schekmanbacteria bacterium]
MSSPALKTRRGAAMFHVLEPFLRVGSVVTGGLTLEGALLLRHRLIDETLDRLIRRGDVRQVVEIAGGLSARGVRVAERYRSEGLTYVEGDLPDMAAQKRAVLASASLLEPNHHIVAMDALADTGELSLGAATRGVVDEAKGTAVITEGLLPYFDRATVEGIWRRLAQFLRRFPRGAYISDLNLRMAADTLGAVKMFRHLLSWYTGGAVHWHFADEPSAVASLRSQGFGSVSVHAPSYPPPTARVAARISQWVWPHPVPDGLVRVLEAIAGDDRA